MCHTTRIEVTPQGCRLTRGALAPRRLRSPDGTVRVALVATVALLLAGDRVRIEIFVRGRTLEVVEVGGTTAYDMRTGKRTHADWDVDIQLSEGAHLSWRGEPFVVSEGADVRRNTVVDLRDETTVTIGERLVLGRSGERGGRLVSSMRAMLDDVPLLAEDLDLGHGLRENGALIGPHRCLETIVALGHRLPAGAGVLQLAGPGSVARWMGHQQHRSALTWPVNRVTPGRGQSLP